MVMGLEKIFNANRILASVLAGVALLPPEAFAIQLHTSSEGIITHQIGHLFFLFSMVVLMLTITGRELDRQKGWYLIQLSAFFFILWNLDVIAAHFLDNQLHIVRLENISLEQVRVATDNGSRALAWVYYIMKLDHLLCVPAMYLFFKGLSSLATERRQIADRKDEA